MGADQVLAGIGGGSPASIGVVPWKRWKTTAVVLKEEHLWLFCLVLLFQRWMSHPFLFSIEFIPKHCPSIFLSTYRSQSSLFGRFLLKTKQRRVFLEWIHVAYEWICEVRVKETITAKENTSKYPCWCLTWHLQASESKCVSLCLLYPIISRCCAILSLLACATVIHTT